MEEARAPARPSKDETKKANVNLAIRIATAAVGAPLIILLLYKGPPSGFYFLTLPAALLAAWELFNMTHPGDRPAQVLGVAMTAAVSTGVWFAQGEARILLTVLGTVPLAGLMVTLVRLGPMPTAALRASMMGFGPLYVGVPLTMLALIRHDLGDRGPGFVVLTIMFAWFGDTGGYFAGRFLGKHKLYEAVSPKKTVEGSIGGLVGSVFGAVLAHFWFLPSLSQAVDRGERLGGDRPWSRRHPRPCRRAPGDEHGHLSVLAVVPPAALTFRHS